MLGATITIFPHLCSCVPYFNKIKLRFSLEVFSPPGFNSYLSNSKMSRCKYCKGWIFSVGWIILLTHFRQENLQFGMETLCSSEDEPPKSASNVKCKYAIGMRGRCLYCIIERNRFVSSEIVKIKEKSTFYTLPVTREAVNCSVCKWSVYCVHLLYQDSSLSLQ